MKRALLIGLIIVILSSGCSSMTSSRGIVPIKMAVIPVIDTLPIFVAESEGLFKKHNVQVELIPVASAPERDQIIQAGKADGALNETLAVMLFNQQTVQIQAVRYGLMSSMGNGHFFILVSGKSEITEVNGLKGVEIGISQGTIIEYVTTRLLEAQGFKSDQIKTIAVPKIPDRMSLLASGGIKAAVLPDPLAALSVQQGAQIILDDSSNPELGASVISFRKQFIDAHPEEIKSFLAAIEDAVQLINADPEKFSTLLVDKKIVPQPLAGKYKIPNFPLKGIPGEKAWNDVQVWAKMKGIIKTDISYISSVTPDYLP